MHRLEMSPLVSVIRLYDQAGGYEERAPYIACVMVQWRTRSDVYLCAAIGKIDRTVWRMLLDLLKAEGVTTASMERRGVIKQIDLS
jgi:hypothetical protein